MTTPDREALMRRVADALRAHLSPEERSEIDAAGTVCPDRFAVAIEGHDWTRLATRTIDPSPIRRRQAGRAIARVILDAARACIVAHRLDKGLPAHPTPFEAKMHARMDAALAAHLTQDEHREVVDALRKCNAQIGAHAGVLSDVRAWERLEPQALAKAMLASARSAQRERN